MLFKKWYKVEELRTNNFKGLKACLRMINLILVFKNSEMKHISFV